MTNSIKEDFRIYNCDNTNKKDVDKNIKLGLQFYQKEKVDFIIMHPPYMDIVKFTDKENDLSWINHLTEFVKIYAKIRCLF